MHKKLKHFSIPQVCLLLLLAGCLTACTILVAEDGPLALAAIADHDDRITWTVVEKNATFDIYSPSGIGRATVRWLAGDYPERVVLRFHLKGLEELRFTYATTIVTVSVASTGGSVVQQQVARDAGEMQAITADSPYWMQTKLVAEHAPSSPSIPLSAGYIEVELPPHFLRTRQTAFAIAWIDFYR